MYFWTSASHEASQAKVKELSLLMRCVHLRCERIDAEDVSIAVVVISIENDLDGVVAPNPRVAARQRFAEPGHIWLPTTEADIDRLRIVENECLGAQSRGHAASLLGAEEVPGCLGLLPSGLGEVAVDLRRLIDAQGRYERAWSRPVIQRATGRLQ